ncbi:MAG TPA: VOC family protein [Candidatus Binatia bacterium]
MIQSTALSNAHMECRSLEDTLPVLTDLLAFERVASTDAQTALKHPNSAWLLTVHEGGPGAPDKQMHNHFGVRVTKKAEVDAAYRYLTSHQKDYGLEEIREPSNSHGSYSIYFLEPGTNGWEIECFEDVLRKEAGGTRVGGVRAPHWESPMPADRFPGRGYVPQAFTHGTLASHDLEVSKRFYTEVLGLEVHRAYQQVLYVKHPGSKAYLVSLRRDGKRDYSPNFRFTVAAESTSAVVDAHRWLVRRGRELGVRDLGQLRENGSAASFLLCDPDGNWWEVASREGFVQD